MTTSKMTPGWWTEIYYGVYVDVEARIWLVAVDNRFGGQLVLLGLLGDANTRWLPRIQTSS